MLVGPGSPGIAQDDSGDIFFNDYPESGRWFAGDGSLTGFFIEVQNGIVAGLYVGAGADGNNVWLNFSGALEPRFPDPERSNLQAGWQLVSDLYQITDGGCILFCIANDPTREPVVASVGQIRIEFVGRSRAEFRILENMLDEGSAMARPARPIAPLVFGVRVESFDPDRPLQAMPDLEGVWAVARSDTVTGADGNAASSSEKFHSDAGIVRLGPRMVERFDPEITDVGDPLVEVRHPIIDNTLDLLPENADVMCRFVKPPAPDAPNPPRCRIDFTLGPMISMEIDFHSISDARFNVLLFNDIAGTAGRLEFFRLNHD
ncbi:MAG: hypothetical protein RQ847_03785 [Wenzhouxiangellaceae bacterium]|nr:hypothetical protein [Wenzhouxiangellaceae bacterium]